MFGGAVLSSEGRTNPHQVYDVRMVQCLGFPAVLIDRARPEDVVILLRMPGSGPGIRKRIDERCSLYAVLGDTPDGGRRFDACKFQRSRQQIDDMPILAADISLVGDALGIVYDQWIAGASLGIGI